MEPLRNFAPLSLPTTTFPEGLRNRYRIVTRSGEVKSVEASSASEAMEKAGVTDAVRIVNEAYEEHKFFERHVLPVKGSMEMDIALREQPSDLSFLVVEVLGDEKREVFTEMDLMALVARSAPGKPVAPEAAASAEEVASAEPPPAEPTPSPETPVEVVAVDAPATAAVETDHELTPEEVQKLLGDDTAPKP